MVWRREGGGRHAAMSSRPHRQRATAWTDVCRVIVALVGCALICVSTVGFLDEDDPWRLTLMMACVSAGLVLVGLGVFVKPKTAQKMVESL